MNKSRKIRQGAGLIGIERSNLGLSTEVPPWHAFTDWRWKNQSRRCNRNRIVNHCRDRGLARRFQRRVAVSDLDVLTRIESFLAATQAMRSARSLSPDLQRLSGRHPRRTRRRLKEIHRGTAHTDDAQFPAIRGCLTYGRVRYSIRTSMHRVEWMPGASETCAGTRAIGGRQSIARARRRGRAES